MVAFAYQASEFSGGLGLSMLMALCFLMLVFQTPPQVSRWRVLTVVAVAVLVIGGVSLWAAEIVFPNGYTCETLPWWMFDLQYYCWANGK